jgi:hypothetical protein
MLKIYARWWRAVGKTPSSIIGRFLWSIVKKPVENRDNYKSSLYRARTTLGEVAWATQLPFIGTVTFSHLTRLSNRLFEDYADFEFEALMKRRMKEYPLRRAMLAVFLHYGDINEQQIFQLYQGDARVKFEDWLNEE